MRRWTDDDRVSSGRGQLRESGGFDEGAARAS
jgi:hypothetical protein